MRLDTIQNAKDLLSTQVQELPVQDIGHQLVNKFCLVPREPLRRRFVRWLAPRALQLQQAAVRRRLGFELSFPYDRLCLGERFSYDASSTVLLELMGSDAIRRVLVPGCYVAGDEVQFWLRRGVERLEGVDVYSLQQQWSAILPQLRARYAAEIHFRQASIEALPFEDGAFDLVVSSAVLEHVRNLSAMVKETARVLRSGGWAWHSFGPLYYSYGGDHCIAAYGAAAGYDHLSLEDDEYQRRIGDQAFFDAQPDPNSPFWARRNQFSFATASEYLRLLAQRFTLIHVVVKISEEGLAFRTRSAERWTLLKEAGISEEDLLIKSLIVVLHK